MSTTADTTDDLGRTTAFRMDFARRQAALLTEFPGGIVVQDPEFPGSHEHNQLIVDGPLDPAGLPALADQALGRLPHRRVSVLDDGLGTACLPVLTAAGYSHELELVMARPGAAAEPGLPRAETVSLADLRPAVARQTRAWMPEAEQSMIDQLVERRSARLRGADEVRFLAVRDERHQVAASADVYLDRKRGIGQIEEVVTLDDRTRRGYAGTLLRTALDLAADCPLFFLVADADDWPRRWYARLGFRELGHTHAFSRTVG
ncbi:GNAT family N-acetyltransferase [Streptacidiphilus carbonis]|jgi:GNAT superfamily N-acetyltransferase|uniref:GNAT family N-acetyltransferase n=1 Tax=Streptacidiphilus carbonis TaxID=105422 RepID=UPI0005A9EE60|nr:GNAT family N-acetyltransferase [Streptacidiphilus carbonis]